MDASNLAVLLELLASTHVQALFLTLSLVALIVEAASPGAIAPALASGFLMLLFLTTGVWTGRVAPEEVLGFVIGFLLMLLEWKVMPGHGVAGVGGLSIVLASLFLALLVPSPTTHDVTEATFAILTCLMLVGGTVVVARPWRRFEKSSLVLRDRHATHQVTPAHLVGREGTTVSDCRPAGRARFGDEVVPVLAMSGYIERGARVVGRSLRATELVVEAEIT